MVQVHDSPPKEKKTIPAKAGHSAGINPVYRDDTIPARLRSLCANRAR